MISAITATTNLGIELPNKSSRITCANVLPATHHLFVGLSNGQLLVYQLTSANFISPDSPPQALKQEEPSSPKSPKSPKSLKSFTSTTRTTVEGKVKLDDLQIEELTLISSIELPIDGLNYYATQIEFIPSLKYLIVLLSNQTVEIYSLNDDDSFLSRIDKFEEFKFSLIETWSDIEHQAGNVDDNDNDEEDDQYYDTRIRQNDSDSISLATVQLHGDQFNEKLTDKKLKKQFVISRSNYNYLCIASKRHLIIIRWLQNKYDKKFEFKLSDRIKLIEFLNQDSIIVGLHNNDLLKLTLSTGLINNIQIQFLNPTQLQQSRSSFFFSSYNDTLLDVFKSNNDQQLNIFKDYNLLKLNNDLELISFKKNCNSGDFKNLINIPSSYASSSHGKLLYCKYWFPYLVGVYGNAIQLRSLEDGHLIQIISLDNKIISSGIIDIKFINKTMLLITSNNIIKFVKSDYKYQLTQFENNKEYNDAIYLIEKLNPLFFDDDEIDDRMNELANHKSARQMKFLKLRKFQLLKGVELLQKQNFDSAIKLFVEFISPPDLVLNNLPEHLSELLNLDDNLDEFLQNRELEQQEELQRRITMNSVKRSNASVKSFYLISSPMKSTIPSPLPPPPKPARNLTLTHRDGKLINQLITYLTDTRRKLTRLLDPESPQFQWHGYLISLELYEELANTGGHGDSATNSLELIDNYLFQCYLLTNIKMVGPLLRISNYCTFEIVERKCLKLKLYNELIDFYYFRKTHRNALELLYKLCFDVPVPTGRRGSHSARVNNSPTSSLSFLFNVDFMVKYLQKLNNDNLPLILEYSKKLIETDQGYFNMIFMSDSIECESLNCFKVFEFLGENSWTNLQLQYLEYIVFETGFHSVKLINKLIELYINIDYIANYDKLLNTFALEDYNATHFLKKLNGLLSTTTEIDDISRTTLLKLIIHPNKKLGKHSDVLRIFINYLKDNRSAIDYCVEIFENDKSLGQELGYELIDLCLESTSANDGEISVISSVLDPKLNFLDPIVVLDKLPNETSLDTLKLFIEFNVRSINTELKKSTIENELLKVGLIDQKLNKLEKEREHVRLTANSICPVCGKHFSSSSVICFYPNGKVLHYGCMNRKT